MIVNFIFASTSRLSLFLFYRHRHLHAVNRPRTRRLGEFSSLCHGEDVDRLIMPETSRRETGRTSADTNAGLPRYEPILYRQAGARMTRRPVKLLRLCHDHLFPAIYHAMPSRRRS